VRQGFRSGSTAHVQEALEWVLTRQGLPGSYRNLFSPTERDISQGLQLQTGERYPLRKALTRHILGEEALRTAIVWGLRSSPAVSRALEGFNDVLERGGKDGFYCCYTCTVPFLRTLAVVKPNEWDTVLEKGLDRVQKARKPDGRWHGFPFYYTLLALSEMDTPSARNELRHASKAAERLLKRRERDDRTSRFRRLALERALRAV